MEEQKKHKTKWKTFYWMMVLAIFVALIFLVRFVLNSSKIFVDQSTVIHPYYIEWPYERDGSLRINEPYFLKSTAALIKEEVTHVLMDSAAIDSFFNESEDSRILRDIKEPFLIWKDANNDTIHVVKNNVHMKFKLDNN